MNELTDGDKQRLEDVTVIAHVTGDHEIEATFR